MLSTWIGSDSNLLYLWLLSQTLGIIRARTGWLWIRIMWLSAISGHGGLVSQSDTSTKWPWVPTVTRQEPSWYDLRFSQGVKQTKSYQNTIVYIYTVYIICFFQIELIYKEFTCGLKKVLAQTLTYCTIYYNFLFRPSSLGGSKPLM